MHEHSHKIARIVGGYVEGHFCSNCGEIKVEGQDCYIPIGKCPEGTYTVSRYIGHDYFNDDAAVATIVKPWMKKQGERFLYHVYIQLIQIYPPITPMRILTLPPNILCQAILNAYAIKDLLKEWPNGS